MRACKHAPTDLCWLQVSNGQSSVDLEASSDASTLQSKGPFTRAKPASKGASRTYDEASQDADSSNRRVSRSYDDDHSASSSNGLNRKPRRSSNEATSSSDDPEEMTAHLADALRGNEAWQSRQVQRGTPALRQKPKSSRQQSTFKAKQTSSIGNEGRVVVSQDTLLRWLEHRD